MITGDWQAIRWTNSEMTGYFTRIQTFIDTATFRCKMDGVSDIDSFKAALKHKADSMKTVYEQATKNTTLNFRKDSTMLWTVNGMGVYSRFTIRDTEIVLKGNYQNDIWKILGLNSNSLTIVMTGVKGYDTITYKRK